MEAENVDGTGPGNALARETPPRMRTPPSRFSMRSVAVALALLGSIGAVLLVSAPTVSATTYVRGVYTTDVTWGVADTVYIATGAVTIRAPRTLTIMPGTTVKFDPGVHRFVARQLKADGTPSKPITFAANTSSLTPWGGIQFNASSSGSVSWSTFDRVDRAISATDSSPDIISNKVIQAGAGFVFLRSSSYVSSNTIIRATSVGVYANASSVQISGNAINNTAVGIQIEQPGFPTISGNAITNVSSGFAMGILLTGGATASIDGNTVQGIRGSAGAAGIGPGAPGRDGSIGAGIYVSGAPSASITSNVVDSVSGGRGGDGQANTGGTGGRGGNGGSAAGIVVVGTTSPMIQWNMVTTMTGGNGGSGGGSATTTAGGRGGDAGTAVAIEVANSVGISQLFTNTAGGVTGGGGGLGGNGGTTNGNGGTGGDADAVFLISARNVDASGNSLQSIRGGIGGNGAVAGGGSGNGGAGGAANGVAVFYVAGPTTVHANTLATLVAGDGGRSVRGGYGGNATGLIFFGNNDGAFNKTQASFNQLDTITAGAGGIGTRFGGNGGTAAGIAAVYTSPDFSSNGVTTMQGGRGGDSVVGTNGGRGGDAYGVISGLVLNGLSAGDTISSVTKGGAGTGPPIQTSYADGYYLVGNKTFKMHFTAENATLSSIGSYEFFVDNYTQAIAVNSPFTKLAVMAAGNLTVRNFLEVDALWPNGFMPVGGARIKVSDGSTTIWDRTAPSGIQSWILVTDRIYVNSPIPTDNVTQVSVTYPPYAFTNDPRSVDMGTSHTESFVMVDKDAPTSAASPLPTYENTLTFWISYGASDGNGTGVANVTLWYRTAGSAIWIQYSVQPGGNFGFLSFTASADGVYEFATTAEDASGNQESQPSANDTWTMVDTVGPGSHVNTLGQYENRSAFLVSWGPDVGVTDRLVATAATTSGTFTGQDGHTYQFRSVATDHAGNTEAVSGNESWTIVDVTPPESAVTTLPRYENTLQFAIAWGPVVGTTDIAAYLIQWKDGANPWTDLVGYTYTTATGATFVGQDPHVYAFRSIARDRAGNVETPPATNDTWTVVDVTKPFVTDSRPVGSNTNLTPWVVVTFNEPMNRTSVEAAFSITPAIDGASVWSSDSRVMTFVPARDLDSGATYFVVIDPTARDLAGNTMVSSKTFQFSTAPGFLAQFWWILVLVGAAVAAAAFLILRRRGAEASKPAAPPPTTAAKTSDAIVEDVFLLNHKDGLLIKHETRRLRPDVDMDILSGMLTAVQAFVKDALRGDDYADLNEMTVGHMHILIGRGKWLVLAARIEGDGSQSWTTQIERCIKDMEDHHWDQIEDWDGDMGLARVLTPYIKKLIQGGYT